MDSLNVAGYGANSYTGNILTDRYQAVSTSGSSSSSAKKTSLGMNDYLQLMVQQMKNQDIMNPQDNSQFVAQMAQFSSLQAMTELKTAVTDMQNSVNDVLMMSSTQYGASLMGKKVKISYYDKDNKVVDAKGVVNSVVPSAEGALISLTDDPKTYYHLSSIMEIVTDFTDSDSTNKTPEAVDGKSDTPNNSESGNKVADAGSPTS